MVPSRSQAISRSQTTSRAWLVAIRCSRRSSIHFTGRPAVFDANGNEEVLGIELAAHAEGAADVAFDHGDGVFREHELRGEDAPDREGNLRGAVDRQMTARRIPVREQPARFHRHRGVALHPEALAPHVRRVLERGVGVAAHRGQRRGAVRRRAVDQQSVVRARSGGRRQRFDIELDRFQRIFGRRRAVGDDDRDRLADIADLAVRNDRLLVGLERRHLLLPQRNCRHRAERREHIRRRDHGMHAAAGERGRFVDGSDAAMRHRAAQDRGMQETVAHDVVDILAAAAQEPQILDALDRAADQRIQLGETGAHSASASEGSVSSRISASNASRLQPRVAAEPLELEPQLLVGQRRLRAAEERLPRVLEAAAVAQRHGDLRAPALAAAVGADAHAPCKIAHARIGGGLVVEHVRIARIVVGRRSRGRTARCTAPA